MDKDLLDEKFKHCDEKLSNHEDRIEKLEDTYSSLQNLNYRMGKVENGVDNINKKLDSISSDTIKEKAIKWDKLIDYLFYFFVATILGYVAIKLGLK